jgi:hypothetical protein
MIQCRDGRLLQYRKRFWLKSEAWIDMVNIQKRLRLTKTIVGRVRLTSKGGRDAGGSD